MSKVQIEITLHGADGVDPVALESYLDDALAKTPANAVANVELVWPITIQVVD